MQVVHIPLLRYIGPYQYPVYYEQQKMKLLLLKFPIHSLEVFTSVVMIISFIGGGEMTPERQNSFFTYLASVIALLFIHIVTFYFVKPGLKLLLKKWEDKVLKELKLWNVVRLALWLTRLIILVVIML